MPHKLFAYEPDFYKQYLDFRSDIDKIRDESNKKEIAELRTIAENGLESTEKLYYVENGNAHIPIIGSLTNRLDICAFIFGVDQTLYSDVAEQTQLADQDPEVTKIIYDVDSPGGTVAGVELTAEAIRSAEKPTEARVYNKAASAAYWLASQADKIFAADRTSRFGSIGVVVEYIDTSGRDSKEGIRRIPISSTDAPDKRVDLTKEEGQAKMREQLDDVHKIFIETVALGRNTTPEDVNENFGRGGMLIADKALAAGMIDGILIETKSKKQKTPLGEGINIIEEKSMDKEKLKADFPDLYKAIYNEGRESVDVKAAEKTAVTQDRERVSRLLTVAAISPDIISKVNSDLTSGDYAEAELIKQNEVRAAAAAKGGSGIVEIKGVSENPGDDAIKITQPVGVKGATKEQAAEIDAWDNLYPKKEAV